MVDYIWEKFSDAYFDAETRQITASIQNQGYLPTNITEQAIRNQTAKGVWVSISLEGAELVFGEGTVDIGNLPGDRSLPETVEWMIKSTGRGMPTVVVTAVSEKGGTHSRTLTR